MDFGSKYIYIEDLGEQCSDEEYQGEER